MKKQLLTAMMMIAAVSMLAIASPVYAQAGGGQWGNGPGEFIDEDGNGFNDLAPDADGDGIPNGQDDDFVPPQDGSGAGFGGNGGNGNGPGDGSGNGNGGSGNGNGHGPGAGNGPGDGSGNGDCIIIPEPAQAQIKVLLAR
jgi:hypothetical protein